MTALCPNEIQAKPLVAAQFSGSVSALGTVVSQTWELLGGPSGSSPEAPTSQASGTGQFMPDLAGEYQLRFTAVDDNGQSDMCEVSLTATTAENIRIELYWNPPENPADPTDFDLHLLHPSALAWFDGDLDCYYANCNAGMGDTPPDWDVVGNPDDDPHLDLDDVDGFGPENINLVMPTVGAPYTVGVHYFSDDGWGPSDAYVKIYCGMDTHVPVYETGPRTLSTLSGAWDGNDFWKVATVSWNGTTCVVTPIDTIVTASEARASR